MKGSSYQFYIHNRRFGGADESSLVFFKADKSGQDSLIQYFLNDIELRIGDLLSPCS